MNKGKQNDFFDKVFEVVKLIPKGKVTTYGAIAKYLGAKGAARTVGWALNTSHNMLNEIPAHRVVNRLGILSGKAHFNPPESMVSRLEQEGVSIKNDEVVDFSNKFWDPFELDKEL